MQNPKEDKVSELREKVTAQVNAYTTLKGGNPRANTYGAYMAIDNIMELIQSEVRQAICDELDWLLAHGSWLEPNVFNAVRNHIDERLDELQPPNTENKE